MGSCTGDFGFHKNSLKSPSHPNITTNDGGFRADFASDLSEASDEVRSPLVVPGEDPMLWSPDCDPNVIDECSHLAFIHAIMYDAPVVHSLHDFHEEDFSKGCTLSTPCYDPIVWYCVPWVCIIALQASGSHVHLESQCHKHFWVFELEPKLDKFDNADIVVKLFHVKKYGPIVVPQVSCSFIH